MHKAPHRPVYFDGYYEFSYVFHLTEDNIIPTFFVLHSSAQQEIIACEPKLVTNILKV